MKKSGLCILALFLAACANPPEDRGPLPDAVTGKLPDSPPVSCAPPSSFGGFLFWMEPPAVPAGASLVLQPWFTPQPGVMEPVPAVCLEGVAISGPAALGEDGRTVVVDAEAAPGATIQVQGRVGEATLSGRILVYQAEAQPLVGTWSQPEDACEGAETVRELIFHPDGTFSLTWRPFEVYKDYWGTYEFDAATSFLRLVPEGGNHIPSDASLAGDVRIDSDALTLPRAIFGSPATGKSCTAPFQR